MALRFDPFDTDARIAALSQVMARDAGRPGALGRMRAEALTAIRFARSDARAYSALGALDERSGRTGDAFALYDRAVALSGTEIHALARLFSRAAAEGEGALAIGLMDRILRRYPHFWPHIAPVLPGVIAARSGEPALRRILRGDPPWRRAFLNQLVVNASGARFAASIIIAERAAGTPVSVADRNIVVGAFLRHKAYAAAYGFFLATMTGTEGAHAGYIFNPRFTTPLSGSVFDWKIRRAAGADLVAADHPGSVKPLGLAVTFIDAPARLGNVSEVIGLPPGTYTLNATAEARDLVAPKGLFWQVSCLTSHFELGRTAIPGGTYAAQTFKSAFEVPANCPLQELVLRTGVGTSSWQSRYRGWVAVHELEIDRG